MSASAVARLALLAHPAGHSVSPAMMEAAFAAVGRRARYDALDVPPEELAAAVAALRQAPWVGANVSVPHKAAVVPLLDELRPTARRLGAVNVVVRDRARLIGDNSDLPGFARALAALGPVAGRQAVVLGAGGAARAVVAALRDLGMEVAVHNRSPERACALVAALGGGGATVLADADLAAAVAAADLLVQTTTVGMAGGPLGSPLPEGVLPTAGAVVDLVYRPAVTPLLRAARAAGLVVQNGLPMLVHQGAAAFEAWTGLPAPVDAMGRAAEAALGGAGRGWTGLADGAGATG
ncbi:MAG: shikimate dehydrogenase [Trueperaceae bacterium]|nr:shikimate dehydrogenase [Trueperaceae bacterium]